MTLEQYTPERLEDLAMRFFDLSAQLREMARIAKSKGVEIPLHDKKAIQWCENLEIWLKKSRLSLDIVLHDQRESDHRS